MEPSLMNKQLPTRVVRVSFTDTDATDSSSSDDDVSAAPKVKRYVTEIRLPGGSDNKRTTPQGGAAGGEPPRRTKYRGVRRRESGRWSAEIRSGTKRWLGTYDTAEEAAVAYDRAVIRLKGPGAVTNFAWPSMAAAKPSRPTSVSRFQSEQQPNSKVKEWCDLSSSYDSSSSMSDGQFVTNFLNEPMFFMDLGFEKRSLEEKYVFDVPFSFMEEEDLGSCKWDVETYFQDSCSSLQI